MNIGFALLEAWPALLLAAGAARRAAPCCRRGSNVVHVEESAPSKEEGERDGGTSSLPSPVMVIGQTKPSEG